MTDEIKTTACECGQLVVPARTDKGREFVLMPEPVALDAGGKFSLHNFSSGRYLVIAPPIHLAFGRKLYAEHKGCRATRRAPARRKAVTS